MQDDEKKSMIMLPELYVGFIVMIIMFFAGFVIVLTYNLLHHDNDIVPVVILLTIFGAATIGFPFLGLIAGAFDSMVLDKNRLIVLRRGRTKQIIEKANVMAIEKEIIGLGAAFIRIDYIQSDNQDKKSILLSYSKKRMETIKSWLNEVVECNRQPRA